MKRLCVVGLVCLVLAGCQWPSRPGVDPFLGPTRVDPPATGSLGGPAAPSYLGPAPSTPAPGVTTPVPSNSYNPAAPQVMPSPTPNNSYTPPGGTFNYRQSSVDRTKAISPSPTSYGSQAAVLVGGSGSPATSEPADESGGAAEENAEFVEESGEGAVRASHDEAIRLVGPTDSETADGAGRTAAASKEPRRLQPTSDTIDIMDLPKAGTSKRASTAAGREGFRVVGASATSRPQADSPSSPSAQTRYGRDSDYRWLKGQLEYSEVSRQWKLRYVPIDGQTDQYGGSVVLGDSPLLKDFKRGDFVTVQGTLGGKNAENGGFAPTYRLDQIK
jgi:hypothetical protein